MRCSKPQGWLCAAHGSPAGRVCVSGLCFPPVTAKTGVFFQSRSQILHQRFPVHQNCCFPASHPCCTSVLRGTLKYTGRRIILLDIPWISNICIPASSLCIVCCLCNYILSSAGVTVIAIVLIAADESWAFEIISGSYELWKQNNIISSLLFLVFHENEIYTELNYILYLMCCFNWTNIYK